jgi:hypothetical protein
VAGRIAGKFQIPSTKFQTNPKTKFQISRQTPIAQRPFGFPPLDLVFVWNLVLGIWNFG